jgi:8-oxo-dGTP pyrophosphatase MutT (NUDIX family)
MRKAARAIIIEDGKVLVMHRNKEGSQYFTLVGGQVKDSETIEQGLVREIKEETGLDIASARLVFYEEHPAPYNEQYIYLCEVNEHQPVAIQTYSEESFMNQISIDTHDPQWVDVGAFPRIPFRTPQLQNAIAESLKKGFPAEPVKI